MSELKNFNHLSTARTMAFLMVLQMILGLSLNFYFLRPILGFNDSIDVESLPIILGCAALTAIVISSINLVFGLLLPKEAMLKHLRSFISLMAFATVGIAFSAYEYAQLSEYVTYLVYNYSADSGAVSSANDVTKKSFGNRKK